MLWYKSMTFSFVFFKYIFKCLSISYSMYILFSFESVIIWVGNAQYIAKLSGSKSILRTCKLISYIQRPRERGGRKIRPNEENFSLSKINTVLTTRPREYFSLSDGQCNNYMSVYRKFISFYIYIYLQKKEQLLMSTSKKEEAIYRIYWVFF